ncbi:MAG TPA: hypothetical protein VFB50_00210 [Chloroflexota bacterium]|nr:hypothetical protein [Chloroflexota bacterium]
MPRTVTVLVLAPGDAPIRLERIDGDDSNELTRLVEGNLGTCSLPVAWRQQDWYAFCDDDAMIRPEPLPAVNRWANHLGHAVLRGPIVIVKTDYMGETRSLSRADVADLEMRLHMQPTKEALEAAHFEEEFWKQHPGGFAIMNQETGEWESL